MKKLLFSKKGFTISDLSNIGITLVILAIILGIGATILANIQATQTTNSVAYNTSGFGLTGLSTLGSYVPTIALVAVAAVVVGIVLTFFGRNRG